MSEAAFVKLDGVRLDTRSWGGPSEALPVLLLHEGLGSISLWGRFPDLLARRLSRQVFAWSRQGHGGSAPIPAPRDPDYMHREAARVPALMDRLGLDRAHVLGHSDGASIALILAARSPARVASLILEAPHVYVEPVTVESIVAIRRQYETTDMGRRMGRHHNDPDHIFRRWNDIWLDPRFIDWSIQNLLGEICAPVLQIQGEDDEYGTLDQLDRIRAAIPSTQTLVLKACGHSPHRDHPELVADAVERFLASVDL